MRAKMDSNWKWSFHSRLAAHVLLTPIERGQWRRAQLAVAILMVVAAFILIAIALWTDWDVVLADRAFDVTAKAFPLRHAWVTEVFNHVILKQFLLVIALAFLIAVLWDFLSPRPWKWVHRFQLRVVALSAVLVPTVISLLKQSSDSHCPWDLQRYGGTEPYVRLFESLPDGIAAGNCMPAGHASSALWMISLSVFFLPHRLLRAAFVLLILLGVGVAVGWLQQLRGAHFLTHTLWSAWIAMLTVFLIMTCMDRWPKRRSATELPPLAQVQLQKQGH